MREIDPSKSYTTEILNAVKNLITPNHIYGIEFGNEPGIQR